MAKRRKPEGLAEFQKLMRPLAQVPKEQLAKQVEKYEQRKTAKKKKKS